jgi:hypothetical protein
MYALSITTLTAHQFYCATSPNKLFLELRLQILYPSYADIWMQFLCSLNRTRRITWCHRLVEHFCIVFRKFWVHILGWRHLSEIRYFVVFLRLSLSSLAYIPYSIISASFRMVAHTVLILAFSISWHPPISDHSKYSLTTFMYLQFIY